MSRLVYSTERGRLCPDCQQSVEQCLCKKNQSAPAGDGIVRLRRETKGRKGKGVTIVSGIALPAEELKQLAKAMKQALSTGGSVKDFEIEIQGDQRQAIKAWLEARDFTVKG